MLQPQLIKVRPNGLVDKIPNPFSEAVRCHEVLINHAKQKRKGHQFLSPSAKVGKKTLFGNSICFFYMIIASWKLLYLPPSKIHLHRTCVILRRGSSMDVMETLPMDVDMLGIPDFDLTQPSLGMHYPTDMS